MTAKWVGVTPTEVSRASVSSFHSMLQKPDTAPIGNPSDLRVSGGSAWKALKMKPEPSTRKRWSPFFMGYGIAWGIRPVHENLRRTIAERLTGTDRKSTRLNYSQ